MTQVTINNATRADYPALLEVWEAPVRATHPFWQRAICYY